MALALLSALGAAVLAAPPVVPDEPASELEALRRIEAEFFASLPACPDFNPSCEGEAPPAPAFGPRTPDALTTLGLRPPVGPAEPAPLPGFRVPVVLNGPVRAHLELFKTRGKFIFARWLARMGRYRALMTPILEAEGVPPELVYVCMIESGFDVDAVSPASAVGPWQFIASTARAFGLRLDEWIDERRDPVKATRAAARYLKHLYEKFGSWPLALAAYNAGPGTVLEAVRRVNSNDYWALVAAGALPAEASRYVPRILSAMILGEAAEQHGFGEVVREPALAWAEVLVPGGMDLRELARWADVAESDLAALNPELRRGFTPPDGTDYALRVPPAAAERLERALAARQRQGGRTFVEHRVRFGERLRDIGAQYGVGRGELRRLNELPHGEPAPGRVLLVPAPEQRSEGTGPHELLVVLDTGLKFDPGDRQEVFFPVRHRMAVAEVADFFRVRPADVGMWNGLDPGADLQRGMVLRLFVAPDFDLDSAVLVPRSAVTFVRPGSEAASNALAHARKERAPTVRRVVHEVRPGDTLWRIANRYGVTVAAIRAENGLGRRTRLSPGDELEIPVQRTPPPRGKAAKRKAKQGGRGRRHRVRSGDSLWSLATRYGTTIEAIRRRNGLRRGALLRPGQVLRIP